MENKKELYNFLHEYENDDFHIDIDAYHINLWWKNGLIMFFDKTSNISHLKQQFKRDFDVLEDKSELKNDITDFYNYIKTYLYRKDKIKNLLF